MAELDIADLIRGLYEQSTKTRRNPARHPADTTGRVDEIPISLVSQTIMGVLGNPLWGEYIYGNKFTDNFVEVSNKRVSLEDHISDTGHRWTSGRGSDLLTVDTGAWVTFGGRSLGDILIGNAVIGATPHMAWSGVAGLVGSGVVTADRTTRGQAGLINASVISPELTKVPTTGQTPPASSFMLFDNEVNNG